MDDLIGRLQGRYKLKDAEQTVRRIRAAQAKVRDIRETVPEWDGDLVPAYQNKITAPEGDKEEAKSPSALLIPYTEKIERHYKPKDDTGIPYSTPESKTPADKQPRDNDLGDLPYAVPTKDMHEDHPKLPYSEREAKDEKPKTGKPKGKS